MEAVVKHCINTDSTGFIDRHHLSALQQAGIPFRV
jgi:hypothetical protein